VRRRFGRRLVLVMVLLAVVPTVAVGWVLIDINQRALRDRTQELLFAVTDDVAHAATATLDRPRAALDAVARALAEQDRPTADRLAAARALVEASRLGAVAIYDDRGGRIDAIVQDGAAWRGPATLSQATIDRATADGVAFGAVETVGDAQIVSAVVPVRGSQTTWFAAAPLSLAPLSARLAALAHDRFDDHADVFVVDADLRTIVHPDPEIAATRAPADSALLADLGGGAIGNGILVYQSFDGPSGRMVGVVRSLPGLPWAVVAQLPAARAFASLDRMRWSVAIAVALAALIAAAAGVVLARRTAAPIARLAAAARDLGHRRFAETATAASSPSLKTGDELETLADALAAAGTDLAASEAQLAGEIAIRRDLGRYLPAQLVERIARRDHGLGLGGTRRVVSVLFADVVAFTSLAEREPPDRVAAVLNQLFTILTEVVFRHGGTVDKFIGDCVMAFWNAPDDQPDHAARAVAAAIDMQRWMDAANDSWEATLGLRVDLAIGVHTGEAIVGNLGSEVRMEYTCIGDTINVAARLEALARPAQILVSAATRKGAGPSVSTFALGTHRLPGRLEPVEVHEVRT
jgi:adenylate cyclase